MKCVKSVYPELHEKHGAVRSTDEGAAMLVKTGHFEYCPKSEWKVGGRRYIKGANPGNLLPAEAK